MSKFHIWNQCILCAESKFFQQNFGLLVITLAVVFSASLLHAQESQNLIPRLAPKPPIHTLVTPTDNPNQIILKFSEGSGIRFREGVFVASEKEQDVQLDLSPLERVLTIFDISGVGIEPLHTRPEKELDAERKIAQRRSGRKLADLNLYFKLHVPQSIDIGAVCDQLNSLPFVEQAMPAPMPVPPPVDIPPPTPDFTDLQGYRTNPPTGIGVLDSASVPGSDGAGTTVVDIEYSWYLDHEDLELDPSANIDSIATPIDPFNNPNHGTAVLGELGSGDNGYGVTGIVPATTLLVAPANTIEFGYNLARAISLATGVLKPGDAILIEQQARVCQGTRFGPVEWHQFIFDAISTATAMGIAVIEAAGNGNVNLDDDSCLQRFDRNVRDSGAIIVGAGQATTRARLSFSSYGSRVDLQGWGEQVTTSGFGNLFDPGDNLQLYTDTFSGTSSASPIVTGAVLAIQGVRMELGLVPVSPFELRRLLVERGTPQTGPAEHIGPLPNIGASLEAAERELAIAVDVLPRRCPNRITVRNGGTRQRVGTAILGTENFDVSNVAVNTLRLGNAAPMTNRPQGQNIRDRATPFEPFIGKRDEEDCNRIGRDGYNDLIVNFKGQDVLSGYGPLSDGEVLVVPLTGNLLDGTPIRGEDVVLIRARGR